MLKRLKLLSLLKFPNIFSRSIFMIIFLGCVDDLVFASVVPHLFLYDLLLLNNGVLHARLHFLILHLIFFHLWLKDFFLQLGHKFLLALLLGRFWWRDEKQGHWNPVPNGDLGHSRARDENIQLGFPEGGGPCQLLPAHELPGRALQHRLLTLQRCNLSTKAQVLPSNIPEVCEGEKGEGHHKQHHSCSHHGVSLNQPGGNHLSLTVSGGVPHRDWQGASHRASHLLPALDFHHDHVDNCDKTKKL